MERIGKLTKVCFLILSLLLHSFAISAADIYVAKNGNDANSGDVKNPLQTFGASYLISSFFNYNNVKNLQPPPAFAESLDSIACAPTMFWLSQLPNVCWIIKVSEIICRIS